MRPMRSHPIPAFMDPLYTHDVSSNRVLLGRHLLKLGRWMRDVSYWGFGFRLRITRVR